MSGVAGLACETSSPTPQRDDGTGAIRTTPFRTFVGPENALEGSVSEVPATSSQFAAIARGPDSFYGVWSDLRFGRSAIFGARLAFSRGVLEPLDRVGVRISAGYASDDVPKVVWDGSHFDVVWSSLVDGQATLQAIRVDPTTGRPTSDPRTPTLLAVRGPSTAHDVFAMTTDVTGILVAYPGTGVNARMLLRPAVPSGTGFDVGDAVTFGRANEQSSRPSVDWSGSDGLVAWQSGVVGQPSSNTVLATRIRRVAGAVDVRDTEGFVVPSSSLPPGTQGFGEPSIAHDASTFFVAWGNRGIGPVFGARILPGETTVGDGGGVQLNASGVGGAPSVIFDGRRFVVVWLSSAGTGAYSLYGASTNASGPLVVKHAPGFGGAQFDVLLGTIQSPSGAFLPSPALATDGTDYALVWTNGDSNGAKPLGSLVGSKLGGVSKNASPDPLLATTPQSMAFTAAAQKNPAVASDGTNFYVVWNDARADSKVASLYGVRVDGTTGARIGSPALVANVANASIAPALGYVSGRYVVVWIDTRVISTPPTTSTAIVLLSATIDPATGTVSTTTVDGDRLTGAGSPTTLSGASLTRVGGKLFASWSDSRAPRGIYGGEITIGGTGAVVADGGHLVVASDGARSGCLANDGTSSFVFWTDTRTSPTLSTLFAAKLDASFGFVGPEIAVTTTTSTTRFVASPSSSRLLVNWVDSRRASPLATSTDVLGIFVDPVTRTTSAEIPTAGGIDEQSNAWSVDTGVDGNVQVVWQRRKPNATSDVLTAATGADGTVRDPVPIALADDDLEEEASPKIARNDAGTMLAVYQKFVGADAMAFRAFARVVAPGTATGLACTSSDACASRHCVDGVCCAEACDGTCHTCSANPGTCTAVVGAEDGDTCSVPRNVSRCDAAGACKLVDGANAASKDACLSGFLSDGVCCDSACAGGCDVCAQPGKVGTCSPLPAGATGLNPFCGGDGGVGVLCDGRGGTCPGSCAADKDCPNDTFCNANGSCERQKANGTACDPRSDCRAGGECRACGSGQCVDGVCCNTDCRGSCEACDVPGSAGTCTPVSGEPHGLRAACRKGTDEDPCSAEVCDANKSSKTCSLVGADVSCRTAACSAGSETMAATCDGAGRCGTVGSSATRACAPYACGPTACKTRCDVDSDCAEASTCDTATHSCVSGASCTDEATVRDINGVVTSCAPKKCRAGRCIERCTSVDDCVTGTVCDGAGACVAQTTGGAAEPSSGCSCRAIGIAPENAPGSARPPVANVVLGIVVAGLGLVRRRRRSGKVPVVGAAEASRIAH
ncbi:MAG: hypothetical protein U0169_03000 [Polyangiaceae bacterium]